MSKDYEFFIDGHPSIYKESKRQLKIYFSEPDKGVNQETGLLLFIPGFGGNASSNIYKKMRSEFSDAYNLITVQCDYFGWEFMQSFDISQLSFDTNYLKRIFAHSEINELMQQNIIDIYTLLNISKIYNNHSLYCSMPLKEDLTNFNDMGLMQAIDNITAIFVVIDILKQNLLDFNQGKIIIYGHSHGGYLAYLCNALAPFLVSHIIDNSAWLIPGYLFGYRTEHKIINDVQLNVSYDYFVSKIPYDIEIVSLPLLYQKFKNDCKIICYHGVTDNMTSSSDKKTFCSEVDNCLYNEITLTDVDGEMIKSTDHGLGADFIKLFNSTYKIIESANAKKTIPTSISYKTNKFIYQIDYSSGRPLVHVLNAH
ncbi:DUF2920 family protein [Desulfosporosinus sp. FKA]|uniref:DUF2920 family protein n=1 Tax=Desulfosporosinus sp. FKA TaxID=1969834 RepID=UPI000B49A5B7|nr:DUF2920 family protein [Desulfosporosinus sp. FKA]